MRTASFQTPVSESAAVLSCEACHTSLRLPLKVNRLMHILQAPRLLLFQFLNLKSYLCHLKSIKILNLEEEL